jgi:hypothetical protein
MKKIIYLTDVKSTKRRAALSPLPLLPLPAMSVLEESNLESA